MIPFVDTHFHLWDLAQDRFRYPWLERAHHPILGSMEPIARSHLIADYRQAIEGLGVRAAVHVQADASDPLRETEWLTAVADASGWPHAIVAFVDLTADDWDAALARQSAFPLVRGIRDLRVEGLDGRRDWRDPRFSRALSRLPDHGLHYELRVTHPEAADVVDLLEDVDEVPIVLTHAGLPLDRSPQALRAWAQAIRRLARLDHVHCKISGFGMGQVLSGEPWATEVVRPLVLTCLEAFGTERTFFGLNWPVDTLAVPYPAMLETYRTIVAGLGEDEQHDVLWRNAAAFYRLDVSTLGVARSAKWT